MQQQTPNLFAGGNGQAATLRFLEDKAAAGLWRLDLNSLAMEWSEGLFVLLGQPDSARPSLDLIKSLMHPDDRAAAQDLDRLARDGTPSDHVFRIIRPDARLRWLRSRGETLFDAAGQPVQAIGIVQDVTGQRDTIHSLGRLRERHQSLLAAANALAWTAGSDGEITDLSTGRGGDACSAQRPHEGWQALVHPDDLTGTRAAWHDAVGGRRPFACDHRLREADGSYRWRRSQATPVTTNGRSVEQWNGISLDIHEQKTWPGCDDATGALNGFQVRAARGILNWSVRDLAEESAVSPGVIRRVEDCDGPLDATDPAVGAIRAALTSAGIEFLFPATGKAAVRPAAAPCGRRPPSVPPILEWTAPPAGCARGTGRGYPGTGG